MKSLALNPATAAYSSVTALVSPDNLRAYAMTYCLRGGAVFAAATSNYVLEHSGFAAPWLPWMVLMPAVAIVQNIRSRRQRKQEGAQVSATDKSMRLLQKGFMMILLGMLLLGGFIGWEVAHPLILVLYGAGTCLAGRLLGFRPLLLGGAACALLGVISAALPADAQLLAIAAAMLVSHFVPGMLLLRQSRVA